MLHFPGQVQGRPPGSPSPRSDRPYDTKKGRQCSPTDELRPGDLLRHHHAPHSAKAIDFL